MTPEQLYQQSPEQIINALEAAGTYSPYLIQILRDMLGQDLRPCIRCDRPLFYFLDVEPRVPGHCHTTAAWTSATYIDGYCSFCSRYPRWTETYHSTTKEA